MAQLNPNSFASRKFEMKQSTLIAILLEIVTGGFYFSYWMVRITSVLNKHFKANVIPEILAWLVIIFGAVGGFFWPQSPNDGELAIIWFVFATTTTVIRIVWAFKAKKNLEIFLSQQGLPYTMSGVWTFIFTIIYQYYVLCNIERLSTNQKAVNAAMQSAYNQAASAPQASQPVSANPVADTASTVSQNADVTAPKEENQA